MASKRSRARRPRARRLGAAAFGIGLLSALGIAGISMANEDSGSASTANSVKADVSRRDEVWNLVSDADIPGLESFSVGIDPESNKIGVHLFIPDGLPADADASLQFGDDVTVTVQETSAPTPELNASGGASIASSSGGCSAGFAVGLANGQSGIITAGHCFNILAPANQQTAQIGSVPATGSEYNFGPSDHGIYAINDSPNTHDSLPQVIDDNGIHPVKGITKPTVGMEVCKHGSTTGTTCGKVTLESTRLTYAEQTDAQGKITRPAEQIDNLFMSDLCAEPGDSGAAVYTKPAAGNSNINAAGILSGGPTVNGKCPSKAGFNDIAYNVPMSATPAKSTNPFDDVFLKVAP